MLRGAGLALTGALLFEGAFAPGRLADPLRSHPFGPVLAIDSQRAIPVRIFEYGFQPSRLVIRAGQVVVWRNIGEELHIVSPSTRAGLPIFRQAERLGTVHHLFAHAGRYPYHCQIHPKMRGVIIVRRR